MCPAGLSSQMLWGLLFQGRTPLDEGSLMWGFHFTPLEELSAVVITNFSSLCVLPPGWEEDLIMSRTILLGAIPVRASFCLLAVEGITVMIVP